jgi:hypothetical protein
MRINETYDRNGNVLESLEIPYTQAELNDYALAQKARMTQPITLTLAGSARIFTPTDEFCARLNNKYQTMQIAAILATRWIFDNGGAVVGLEDMEAMALAANNQWQPYFDTIEAVLGGIAAGTITTTAQVDAAFDAAYGGSE